jgi:Endosomal/lysosomal potassium channel TMEM175
MSRETAGADALAPEKHFRWRGGRITRLEGFTDAVFAFAVTLLVVSLEVPRTFADLMNAMKGFAAFGICFLMLTWLWHEHYRFSRRYGLQTPYVIVLNLLLLFVVLFYVYPLKFLFTLLVADVSGGRTVAPETATGMIADTEVATLMLLYCAGWVAVFVIFGLLYQHVWRLRGALQLDEFETLRTAQSRASHFSYAAVGVLVALTAVLLPTRFVGLSGLLFFLNGVLATWIGRHYGRRWRALLAQPAAGASGPAPSGERHETPR